MAGVSVLHESIRRNEISHTGCGLLRCDAVKDIPTNSARGHIIPIRQADYGEMHRRPLPFTPEDVRLITRGLARESFPRWHMGSCAFRCASMPSADSGWDQGRVLPRSSARTGTFFVLATLQCRETEPQGMIGRRQEPVRRSKAVSQIPGVRPDGIVTGPAPPSCGSMKRTDRCNIRRTATGQRQ
jgi:hypothetical protein